MEAITDVKKINRMRCIAGLVGCIIMVLMVLLSYTLSLANAYSLEEGNHGIRTLRMFTTLSNLLVTVGAVLSIPYQIEGLRHNNYHLPRWIVTIIYIGTTGVSITFVTALTAISIVQGFTKAMIANTNLFFHTLNPVLAIILFTFINDDHHIKLKDSYIALIPMYVYTIVYIILVFIIGEESGGWDDHYSFNKFIRWPISLIIMYSMAFGVTNLIRYLHNLTHKRRKESFIRYYQLSPDIKSDSIEEAVIKLAHINRKDYIDQDIIIPKRSINMMKPVYKTSLSDEELYKIYIDHFFDE